MTLSSAKLPTALPALKGFALTLAAGILDLVCARAQGFG
jgi:hypothetical protein